MSKSFSLFLALFFMGKMQQADAQDQAVSIHANNLPLPRVLKELEEKTNYTIVYSNDIVADVLQVTVDMQHRPVSEILRSILEPHGLIYSFRNQHLILIGSKRMREANLTYSAVPLSGAVLGEDDLPIAFATIALFKNNKALTNLACTDGGTFVLDFPLQVDSVYELTASSVGYQTKTTRFVYPDTSKITSIKLVQQTGTLKTVTVRASQPMIDRQIDRLVFNLSNSIAVQGTDVTEALRLTPMVKMTESGVSLIGKGAVSVMINGRMVQLSGTSLISYLRSLRSDDVERIEVITVPPARYEAQGSGGLINIVLKKNPSLGWSGNVNPIYIQQVYATYGLNANINYQSRKVSSSLRLSYLKSRSLIGEQNNLIGSSSIRNSINRKGSSTTMGANLNFNYRLSKSADLGFVYDIGPSTTKTSINLASSYLSGNNTDSVLSTVSKYERQVRTQTLNVYHDQKLDSTGKKISTTVSFFSNIPETDNAFTTTSDHAADVDRIQTYSLVQFKVWSAQSDLFLPYKGVTLETGAKFTHFSNNADVQYYDYIPPAFVIDPSKSNLFNYIERNTAGYVSAFKQLNTKWGAKVGLRYEYTSTRGLSPSTGQKTNTSYGQVFPTAYLNYKPSEKQTFSLAYSKRINRPYLRLVNPFRFYTNPYMYGAGDPLLKPSTTHNLELSYLYKGMLSLTAYGSYLQNGFGDVTFREGSFIIGRPANYLTQYAGGLIATVNLRFNSWWENSSYAQFTASDARSSIADVIVERGFGFNYSTNNTFMLNKTISAFLTYAQTLPSQQNNIYTFNQYRVSWGLRARLDQLLTGITYSDESIAQYRLLFKDLTQSVVTNYHYQAVRFTATYSFGRTKVRGANKNIQFTDKQRAN